MPCLALLFLVAAILFAPPARAQARRARAAPPPPARAQTGHWWEREPLRILDYVTSFDKGPEGSPAGLAARKATLGFNAEHLEIMGMQGGLDDQEFWFHSRVAGKRNADYLRAYLPEARKNGIRVFIYFNVHWYKREFGARHPDWLQIREDGSPLDNVYDTGVSFCVNSPWREWVFQVLRDLCSYPIDGIFFDGPIFFPETCYCRWCREKFEKQYHHPMPSKKQRRGKESAELLEFQAASLADFLRDSRRVIKAINPEIAFYMNGGVRGANWATARLNRVLAPEQDLLGAEGGFLSGDLTRVPLWKPGLNARLLETQAPSKPRVIFSAASHKPWTFSLLPAAELRLLYADSIANAANVWFGITPFEFGQPEIGALAEMNRFYQKNGEYYLGTRSEAKTALIWSDTTANFYAGAGAQLIDIDRVPQRSEVGNLDAAFSGFADALIRSHTPFDVLDDAALDGGDLNRYTALFLPNVACMSEKTAARLREYVRRGGHLFASFETSIYDETGQRRNNFALADLFGADVRGKIAGPTRWDFMKPAPGVAGAPLLRGVQREFIPSTIYHLRVAPSGAQPLLDFTKPLAGRYDGIPGISDEPALLVHRFGSGLAVYFSGDLGSTIQTFHLPEHLRLLANAVREFDGRSVSVENAPQSLEVVLRSQQQGRRLLLHLVNFTGEMTRPIQHVQPLENIRIALPTGGEVKRITTLMHPQTLTPRRAAAGAVQFTLPRMGDYEVIVIDK